MQAGKLRHHLWFQRKDTSGTPARVARNTYGEPAVVWEDDVETWGAIMPVRGTEYFAAGALQSVVTHRIRTRFFRLSDGSRVTAQNRIKWIDIESVTRYFAIQGVINIEERNIQLDFMCVEEA